MNKLTIIGNLTKDPELRTTTNGISVCSFTVAVNRRKTAGGNQETDYFRVSAWRQMGENCQKYLAKGRKVCVIGPVSARTYKGQDGETRVSLEITADDVEFLSPAGQNDNNAQQAPAAQKDEQTGFAQVEDDDLPF